MPWTERRWNQSVLKENPEYSLEGRMLKPKLQYFGHLMWTDDSLEKSLMLGKIEGRRRRGCQRLRWLDSIRDEHELGQTPEDNEEQRGLACCSPWGCQLSDATGRLNNNNNNKYYLVYMCNIFFIQSSIDEVLGCSQVLSFINSAAVNIGVDVSFWMIIFSEYTHSSRITMS